MNQQPSTSEASQIKGKELSDSESLLAFRIAQNAKDQVRSWIKAGVATLVLVGGILGYGGYREYYSMLDTIKRDLDGKLATQVETKIDSYKKLSDQILESVVEAKTNAAVADTSMNELQGRVNIMRKQLDEFRLQLTQLEGDASDEKERFTRRINALSADIAMPQGHDIQLERQSAFLRKSREYASKIGMTLPEPTFVFQGDDPDAVAVYDGESHKYFIAPSKLETVGLPEYVALMGRFFLNNEAFLVSHEESDRQNEFWQDFRYSVVAFVLKCDDIPRTLPGDNGKVFASLEKMVELNGGDAVPIRQLAIEMLKTFNINWRHDELTKNIQSINNKLGIVNPKIIADAITATR